MVFTKFACTSCAGVIWRRTGEEDSASSSEASPEAEELVCGQCRMAGIDMDSECGVCFDCRPLLRKGMDAACMHKFCKGCWQRHVTLKIHEGVYTITCMDPGCTSELRDSDVKRLVPQEYKRFVKNKFADFEKRVRDIFVLDDDFAKWARANTQCCPRCHIIVERTEGCNHVRCRCGHEFCYRCGKPTAEDCNCAYARDGPEFMRGRAQELAAFETEAARVKGAAIRIQSFFREKSWMGVPWRKRSAAASTLQTFAMHMRARSSRVASDDTSPRELRAQTQSGDFPETLEVREHVLLEGEAYGVGSGQGVAIDPLGGRVRSVVNLSGGGDYFPPTAYRAVSF
mmetsp:Transcript_27656/g.81285  ORF Transcript_27656/g.81285 Transcript_27656/m.81285 type:complete len:342 (+) Transcript_27656:43-1068(+)